MSFLFGSAPSVSSVPIRLQSSLSDYQQNTQKSLGGLLDTNPFQLFPQYTGQLTAALDPLQTASIGAASGVPGAVGGAAGKIGGTQSAGLDALTSILGSSPQDLNSYYTTNVLGPLKQTFEQTTLPDILSASGGSVGGYQSTSQAKALSDASNNFMNTLAQTQGQLGFETAQQNITNKLSAANLIPSVTQAPLQTLGSTTTLGGVSQANQQQYLTNLYNAFLQQNQQGQQGIADQLQFLGIPTMTAANQPVSNPGQSGLLSSLVGASGPALGNLVSGLFGGGAGAAAGAAGGAAAGAGAAAAGADAGVAGALGAGSVGGGSLAAALGSLLFLA